MPPDRQFYNHEGGTALDINNDIFDVTAWRQGIDTLLQEIAGGTGGDASTATLSEVVINATTSTVLKTASTDFVGVLISNETAIDIWIKFQPASTDNAKKGIFLERGGYYEMPTGQRYTGEISAISDSGTPTVNLTVY